jgi:hypothetical protein
MTGKWHVAKAAKILDDPKRLDFWVPLPDENAQAKYLERLPALIAETREQDDRCQAAWESEESSPRSRVFAIERDRLVALFEQFQFQPRRFERIFREADKPLLKSAIRLLSSGMASTPEAMEREARVRLPLSKYVEIEQEISADLRILDDAREELCVPHEQWALGIAWAQPRPDSSTEATALRALRRAAANYDYKRGYCFAEYAQWWIRDAIEKPRK